MSGSPFVVAIDEVGHKIWDTPNLVEYGHGKQQAKPEPCVAPSNPPKHATAAVPAPPAHLIRGKQQLH